MTDEAKLLKALYDVERRKRASVFEVRTTAAALCTEDEIEMLKDIAKGGDPFSDKRKQREQDMDESLDAPPIDVHYSSILPPSRRTVSDILRQQVVEAAKFQPDPRVVKDDPETHKFLMRVHKMLKETERLYEEIPNDPMGDIPAAPEDPALHKFQHLYRELKTAMRMLRDHYRNHGHIAPKWVALVKQRFTSFVPVYNEVITRQSEGSEGGEEQEVSMGGVGDTP